MNTLENLKETLANKPNIKKVYFNENGEWLTYPRPNFPIEKTREEVLGETAAEVKTAAEVIEAIKLSTTVEEAEALVVGEIRKSVLTAADKKITELKSK